MKLRIGFFFIALFLFDVSQARAGDPQIEVMQGQILQLQKLVESVETSMADLKMTVGNQNEVIRRQTIQIEGLQKTRGITAPAVQAPMPSVPKAAGILNPDIGVVGTVQTKFTENKEDAEGNNTIALKELELNLQGAVDPYSRYDATLTFNDALEDQNVEIEEAYYTRWGLPLGFTGQIGKFRADIGKANLLHAHALPTADYPLVIRNFFGEEGLASSGLRLKNNIPNPWNLPLEVSGEILRGNNGESFSGISRRPIFNTHLKTFFETSETTNLELGWTTMFGDENPPRTILVDDGTGTMVETSYTPPEGQDRYGVKVFGADATFNWFLPEGKTMKWQNELYFQNRTDLVHANDRPWGFYSLLDYRLSPKLSAGIRFDYLDPLDVAGSNGATAVSPYLIFWQSEYADLKLQYSHTTSTGNGTKTDNAVYLVVDFLAGYHKHPVQ
ncbi:MAG: hypothetical protein PHN49_03655 [Candidatus Omnitrophica bacterium]|nr:hypothetical protein [Candidatus Omnitrophota bacterium]MDD5670714.1 hypothetical protein [Candidatus Omnitrophota bacterium]